MSITQPPPVNRRPASHQLCSDVYPVTIYYCKAGLRTGLPIRVEQMGFRYQCRAVTLAKASGDMLADNATGAAKRSGAWCVMVIRQGDVEMHDFERI